MTVIANCATEKVWIRINIHFFFNDDCTGTLDPLGLVSITPEQAYEKAEAYIEAANLALDNNRDQWNQVFWGVPFDDTRHCVPFRYLLSGVYVHCNTVGKTTSVSTYQLNNYFGPTFPPNIGSPPALNLYVVEFHGGPTGVAGEFLPCTWRLRTLTWAT